MFRYLLPTCTLLASLLYSDSVDMPPAFESTVAPITAEILEQMSFSWKDNNPVPLEDLRYVVVSHWGFDDRVHQGCLIVHEKVADEVVEIFNEIFDGGFPIEKMTLVDNYQGVDEVSAQDNNSYSFCSREITGMKGTFSKHSYGLAIDLNPLYNPYQRGDLLVPQTAGAYLDRSIVGKGTINPSTACYQAFVKRGWDWGGSWGATRGYGDYHHFEKHPDKVLKAG